MVYQTATKSGMYEQILATPTAVNFFINPFSGSQCVTCRQREMERQTDIVLKNVVATALKVMKPFS